MRSTGCLRMPVGRRTPGTVLSAPALTERTVGLTSWTLVRPAADRCDFPQRSLPGVADRLDVVAVGVADEGAEVGRVVLGPQPRLVQRLGAGRQRLVVPRP